MLTTTVSELETRLTADSVEWCSGPSQLLSEIVAVGTYQLDEETGAKSGELSLLRSDPSCSATPLSILETRDTEAILDMKWFVLAVRLLTGASLLVPVTALGFANNGLRVQDDSGRSSTVSPC